MNDSNKRARYILEFKMEAVRLVKGVQVAALTAHLLGVPKHTWENWVRLDTKANQRCRRQTCQRRTNVAGAAACRKFTTQDGARYFKKLSTRRASANMGRNTQLLPAIQSHPEHLAMLNRCVGVFGLKEYDPMKAQNRLDGIST